jgi:hypothetical protein
MTMTRLGRFALVALRSSSVATTLEGAGKSIYFTLESRRSVLEEEEKGPDPEVGRGCLEDETQNMIYYTGK